MQRRGRVQVKKNTRFFMQTIEIRTAQNVVIEYELASLRERLLAFLIDLIIIGAILLMLQIILFSPLNRYAGYYEFLEVIMGFAYLGSFFLYHFLSEMLADGQSWGKKSMGIKVVRIDGQEPGLSDYMLRAAFHLVDTLSTLGILGILLILSSGKNQRLGDMTANTTVIRLRHNLRFRLEDILNIHTREDYEPQYPEVRQLSEQDMLLIKSTISRYRAYRNEAHREAVQRLAAHLVELLDLPEEPTNKIEFLNTLLRDYIVITR
jgi:uncharacterized RDD family membrane protein YckC